MPNQLNNKAVHCPHCGAAPGQPCKTNSGGKRRAEHSERLHLVYALANPENNFYRAEAERYRMKHPGVQVGAVVCAPSRAQALWYGLPYNQVAYESEHGRDTSVEGGAEHGVACSHPLCRTATSQGCGCACGGVNHGRDSGSAVEDEEPTMSLSELEAQLVLPAKVKRKPKQ